MNKAQLEKIGIDIMDFKYGGIIKHNPYSVMTKTGLEGLIGVEITDDEYQDIIALGPHPYRTQSYFTGMLLHIRKLKIEKLEQQIQQSKRIRS